MIAYGEWRRLAAGLGALLLVGRASACGLAIGARGWPSQAGVNGVGYRADMVDIVEGVAASTENTLPESTVTILVE